VECGSTSQWISCNVPFVTATVCGRPLSWRRQTLLSDRPRRFDERLALIGLYEALNNNLTTRFVVLSEYR
jgi:hypothetical protein